MLRDHRLHLPGWRTFAPASIYTLALFAFIAATRLPLGPHYLYYFDSANFALAMERFNPALHQPQPPGYPLFVALTRIIHLWIARPEQVMLVAGLLAACAATWLIYLLVSRMFGRSAAILSAALLASNPAFWFGGITNEIRLFLALCSVGIALLAWRALTRPAQSGPLYLAFAALGVAGGFRLVVAGLLFILLIWVWWRTGHSPRRLAWAMVCLAATTLPWVAAVVWAVGGLQQTWAMIWFYANDQFHGSSMLFGAGTPAAWHMFECAVVWNFLGALTWLWALPFLHWKPLDESATEKARFLAIWFLAPFLFSAFVHIGDPDQALGSIPVLCVAGGVALASFLHRIQSRRAFAAAALVVMAHALIFFYPPGTIAKASSYHAMKAVDRMNTSALTAIEFLKGGKPLTIVHFGSSVAYREVEYYFPDDYLVVLPGAPGAAASDRPVAGYYHHSSLLLPPGDQGAILPGSRRIVCLVPLFTRRSAMPGWRAYGPVFYKDISPAMPNFNIGPYTLIR